MVNSVMRILRYVIEKKSDCWLRSKSGIRRGMESISSY